MIIQKRGFVKRNSATIPLNSPKKYGTYKSQKSVVFPFIFYIRFRLCFSDEKIPKDFLTRIVYIPAFLRYKAKDFVVFKLLKENSLFLFTYHSQCSTIYKALKFKF